MNLIYPQVDLWKQNDSINHVAKCARVCYASESKSENSDTKLVNALHNRKHNSMFRHESRYFIIEKKVCSKYNKIYQELRRYEFCPYLLCSIHKGIIYISTNGDFYRNEKYKNLIDLIKEYEVSPYCFSNTSIGFEMMRYTFCVITQISTSRELNRTSPNNIAEQSTRYVDFDKKGGITICLPHWWDEATWFKKTIHKIYWKSCELMYNLLLKLGFKAQDARGVLPLDTATKVVYTYTVAEWNRILDLRYREATGKAHPNAKIIASYIAEDLDNLGYNIYNKE